VYGLYGIDSLNPDSFERERERERERETSISECLPALAYISE
jgi:hypothetical protein